MTSNEYYWNGIIPWIQSSDIVKDNLFDVNPKKYITEEGIKNSATKVIPADSIAVVTRVGVGKLAVMPYSYSTSQDFLSISNLKTDLKFSAYLMYVKLQKELNSVQGTSIKGITKDELLSMLLSIPKTGEQTRIGKFLRSLDNLITLHQRKVKMINSVLTAIALLGLYLCSQVHE